jgi:hypothetical protein
LGRRGRVIRPFCIYLLSRPPAPDTVDEQVPHDPVGPSPQIRAGLKLSASIKSMNDRLLEQVGGLVGIAGERAGVQAKGRKVSHQVIVEGSR